MFKRIITAVFFLGLGFISSGCPYCMTTQHTRAHEKNINRGWVEIHQFVDRHFWNYDWDDPNDN